jgi:hypothetical protein
MNTDPRLAELGDRLERATAADLRAEEQPTDRTAPGTARWALRARPRLLAGSTLGLAGLATAAVIAFGGSSAPPAYAISTNPDGSVLVSFNYQAATDFWQLEHRLIGQYGEMVTVNVAPGPATGSGPVNCTPTIDSNPGMPRTPIKVELGQDGTATIPAGDTGAIPGVAGVVGSAGTGPVHVTGCQLFIEKPTGNGGRSGDWSNTGDGTPLVFGFSPSGTSTVDGGR